MESFYPYAPIPSASGFGMGFGYLITEPHRVFGALGLDLLILNTPQKSNIDTQKLSFLRGGTFSKPYFWVSMLVFGLDIKLPLFAVIVLLFWFFRWSRSPMRDRCE